MFYVSDAFYLKDLVISAIYHYHFELRNRGIAKKFGEKKKVRHRKKCLKIKHETKNKVKMKAPPSLSLSFFFS
jgi:hypothetical protein